MEADHRMKLVNGACIAGCSSWEQHRIKKRKFESPKNDLNATSLISLEWDGSQKKVVAKREQIGISQRALRPFVDSVPQHHNILADVFTLPQEIYELENLTEVLSYEAWQTMLSDDERNALMQFLPMGSDVEEVVQALLSRENFNFGNPFLTWGASLCLGNLHPDAVLFQEQCLKADKRAYYAEIQKYHDDMINYLQKVKNTWESNKDPEKELLQKIWRNRSRDAEQKIPSSAIESRFCDLGESAVATSESFSLVGEEKACSSDDQDSSLMKGGDLPTRIHEKDFMKDACRKPLVTSDDARFRKGEKLYRHNIHHSNGANYMSCLKISKNQHQLFKSMKQSGKSIQSKSLNCVLGNLDTLHVQPYEEFVKEEKKKLQEHWLQLASKDLPAAYANWRARQFQRQEVAKCLEQDMKDKINSRMEEEENHESALYDQGRKNHESAIWDQERENHESAPQNKCDQKDPENSYDETLLLEQIDQAREHEFNVEDKEGETCETMLQDQTNQGARNEESNMEDDKNSCSVSLQYRSPPQLSPCCSGHNVKPVDMSSEHNHVDSKSDDASTEISDYSGNANAVDVSIHQGVPTYSGRDIWSAVSMPNSYYDSTANHEHISIDGLLLPHQVNGEQRTQLIDLESDMHEEFGEELLRRQSDVGSFVLYPNHDRSGLLQSLFKVHGTLPYNHGQKQNGLEFQSPNNMMIEDGQFTEHLQGQLRPLVAVERMDKVHNEDCMQQHISESVDPGGGGYLIPRQGHVPPVNLQDWNVNGVCMPPRHHAPLHDDGLLPQNWFPVEHQVRGGWNGSGGASVPNQSIGSNGDRSLFSVPSNYDQLRPSVHFDSIGSTEQFTVSRNYGLASGGAPRISNTLLQTAYPLDCLSGRDTANSLMPGDMGWMNLPQNSVLRDPMGKPYLRSWNQ